MNRNWVLASACAAILGSSLTVSALAQTGTALDLSKAEVARAAAGRPLTAATQAAPGTVVRGWLQGHGASAAEVASLRETRRWAGSNGVTHIHMEQQIDGLAVHGAYVKAAVNARGELVHVISKLADTSTPAATSISPRQALDAALELLYPKIEVAIRQTGASGNTTRFNSDAFFYGPLSVTAVVLELEDGSLARGWRVETWTKASNRLHHTIVDGAGRVVSVENRTATDSYNVFAIDPDKSTQQIVAGPGAGNTESPAGWLSGAQLTTHIFGNNADAYLDRDPSNNIPDDGGAPVADGNFVAVADLEVTPTTVENQAVGVQNLFFLTNRTHDILYGHGFNEVAGNFQVNNFGNGGAEGDPVNAEAQDSSGTDNANFATPLDGSRPRMQMFLWTSPLGTDELVITSPISATYSAMAAQFGKALTTTGISGSVVKSVPADGCAAITSPVAGAIALIDRGTCEFGQKALNAQNAGAAVAVIANNQGGDQIIVMGPGAVGNKVRIPSVMISQNDGAEAKSLASPVGTARRKAVQPPQLDGDLDADIVYHEYGHGLSWRMIGGMSGPLAGAIGEGNSDGIAMLVNGDDLIGEYSSPPVGLRTAPYTDYGRTYGDVAGTEVHFDGEVYAAIIWRLMELFGNQDREALFGIVVDGMNFTPVTPAWEDMRDGMLASIANSGGTVKQCQLVWEAFAQYGVGVGAQGVTNRNGSVVVTESFTPGSCR